MRGSIPDNIPIPLFPGGVASVTEDIPHPQRQGALATFQRLRNRYNLRLDNVVYKFRLKNESKILPKEKK